MQISLIVEAADQIAFLSEADLADDESEASKWSVVRRVNKRAYGPSLNSHDTAAPLH